MPNRSEAARSPLTRGMVAAYTSNGWCPTRWANGPVADEHGVDPCPLEREHLVAGGDVDPGDRELARRYVREQLQHQIERIDVILVVPGREQEDLRIALFERKFELVLVANIRDRLELRVQIFVLGPQANRVGIDRLAVTDPEERQRRRVADPVDRTGDCERFRTLRLGVSRAARVMDTGDDGNPVSLGDALTETA